MSAVEIKICGITRAEDALAAIESGASMLGLNFYPPSPRFISLSHAQQITRAIASHRSRVQLVGVFVNMNVSDVQAIARALPLDAVQLHGDETPEECDALAPEFAVIRALKSRCRFQRCMRRSICGLQCLAVGHTNSGAWRFGRIFPMGERRMEKSPPRSAIGQTVSRRRTAPR